eukprot:TRINITY_DN2137_c0_g1_i4.p1 TRINITY_DN2137_c0_g1~~TRINITY_DN2137_c0_g1_i4.p1  ORF type:complete len:106 (-),score=21.46 TRINITY_DN2137_c0_g1_i4:99-416(-)
MTEHEHRARLFFSTIATGIITTFFLNWYPVPDPTRYKLKDNQGSNSEESNSEEELEENHNSHHRTEMLRKELKHFALYDSTCFIVRCLLFVRSRILEARVLYHVM